MESGFGLDTNCVYLSFKEDMYLDIRAYTYG